MTTREEAIAAAGRELALAYRDLRECTPRESAEAAYIRGGASIDELEQRIRAHLGYDDPITA